MNKIFAVRDKTTGEFIRINGHAAFSSAGKARQSFNKNLGMFSKSECYLENHDNYMLVELTEIYNKWIGNYE